MEAKEVIARALFEAQWRLRHWDSANDYTRKIFMQRAEKAMKRAGVESVPVKQEAK